MAFFRHPPQHFCALPHDRSLLFAFDEGFIKAWAPREVDNHIRIAVLKTTLDFFHLDPSCNLMAQHLCVLNFLLTVGVKLEAF